MRSNHASQHFCRRERVMGHGNVCRGNQTVIVMVGLPARGKTYMAKKLARYLNWIGVETRVFNVGEYRRLAAVSDNQDYEFFDNENESAVNIRNQLALSALDDMCTWLMNYGQVGIFDATNSTRSRRDLIVQKCTREFCFRLMFVESICRDENVIKSNIKAVKVHSPDYRNKNEGDAIRDFTERIRKYEKSYEPLDEVYDEDKSFLKMYDVGESFFVNRITGHVPSRVVYFFMNIHVLPRTIYLTRSSETIGEQEYKLGYHTNLSDRGKEYAHRLGDYFAGENINDLVIWTSEVDSAKQTVSHINAPKETWQALNELNAGLFQGMSYKEMAETYREELAQRDADKFHYRYPNGESYEDLVLRLEPVIMELERAENVLVVTHHAVARCIFAYFTNVNSEALPYINVPLHCLIKLTPVAYGCQVDTIQLGVDAVNTHRDRPKNCNPGRTLSEALETSPGFIATTASKIRRERMSSTNSDCEGLEKMDSLLI
ncbi:hypothetical protein ACOME3_005461 [Neoechinorhynchus agilis]